MNIKNTPFDKPEYQERRFWRRQIAAGTLPIVDTISTWSDLGGFSAELAKAGLDLNQFVLGNTYQALALLHDHFAKPLNLHYNNTCHAEKDCCDRTIIINDGAAKVLDVLSNDIDPYSAARYLLSLVIAHWQVLNVLNESYRGTLGLRTVISSGHRMQYTNDYLLGSELVYHSDEVSDETRDFMDTIFCYIPKQLQLNTALARTYTIESAGSKAGIGTNGFFIDSSVLSLLASKMLGGSVVITDSDFEITRNGKSCLKCNIIKKIDFTHKLFNTTVYRLGTVSVGICLERDGASFDVSDIGVDPFDGQNTT